MKFILTISLLFLFSCEEDCPSGILDCAAICDGTLVVDCAGECAGTKVLDSCGTCDDDTDNDETQGECTTCNGDEEPDCAGNCDLVATEENEADATYDCTGVCEGDAEVDACGICDGEIGAEDECSELCDGGEYDCNGCCPDGANTDGVVCSYLGDNSLDCLGVCGGRASENSDEECIACPEAVDCAGECGGPAQLDCKGICAGLTELDECGICDGEIVVEGECSELCDGGEYDCNGCCSNDTNTDGVVCSYLGDNSLDCLGVCGGPAQLDCAGECGGILQFDSCGICGGDEYICLSINSLIPTKVWLSNNYPNPFNPVTSIEYSVEKAGNVNISIYNLLGRKVFDLVSGYHTPGVYYSAEWNSNTQSNISVSTGIYFYEMRSGNYIERKKMVLVK